jgi:hypothetical protein
MKDEALENCKDLLTDLVHTDYHGDVNLKIHGGVITIASKTDKIKLDNQNYKAYKDRI